MRSSLCSTPASTGRSGQPAPSTVRRSIDGAALETLVYQELRAVIAYRSLKLELFFWRTASGAEVDLVAYGGDGLFAIEVQRSRTIRRADLHGLKQFKKDCPMARCVLLFGGDRREYRDGVELLALAAAGDRGAGRPDAGAGRPWDTA